MCRHIKVLLCQIILLISDKFIFCKTQLFASNRAQRVVELSRILEHEPSSHKSPTRRAQLLSSRFRSGNWLLILNLPFFLVAPGIVERPASSSFSPRERLPERRGVLRQTRGAPHPHGIHLPRRLGGRKDRPLPNNDRGGREAKGRMDATGLHHLQHVGG